MPSGRQSATSRPSPTWCASDERVSGHGAAIAAVAIVAVATMVAGTFGLRRARTTSDFYVASRAVTPRWNAAAIGGEYLSAASYLGIAGLILAYGFDVLWYPVGYTAGYLVLLALVAAPLRRSGAYTLPDFAQLRVESTLARHVASVLVVAIGMLYLIPQFQGAGLTLRTLTGAPLWVGQVVVALVVSLNVLPGGMRAVEIPLKSGAIPAAVTVKGDAGGEAFEARIPVEKDR